MNLKSLLHVAALGFMVIALSACGGKGIDRKLNYSDTEKALGESYGEAMAGATPEQQNILRERMGEIVPAVLSLAKNSNPALIDAVIAKKNADEFERLSEMTVRELFTYYLEKQQATLNSNIPELEKFLSGNALKVENISINDVNPKTITPYTSSINIDGTIALVNYSDNFDYDFRGCQLALILDGKQIEELHRSNDCKDFVNIKSKGGKGITKFNYSIRGEGNIKMFYDLLKGEQMGKIAWNFKPDDSYIRSNNDGQNDVLKASDSQLAKYRTMLQKITMDLAVIKKK